MRPRPSSEGLVSGAGLLEGSYYYDLHPRSRFVV
jgi:hypothetical protein